MKIFVIGGYRVVCPTICYSQLWFKSSFQCLFGEHEKIILFVNPIPCYTFLQYCNCTIASFLSFICEYQMFHDVLEFITYKCICYFLLKQLLSNQSGITFPLLFTCFFSEYKTVQLHYLQSTYLYCLNVRSDKNNHS